ncbi:unnamed protein product [Moneuplotes crassus]|uniref:Uncharacterized protein n=1 Tax=Euplotes crassus TaxID=5936 RepID=A0AAD1Y6F5_EUPCR|nr:unnamed protein product [Moneuplotes crassus]
MSTHENTGESSLNDNTLTDELLSRVAELETKFRDQFDHNPLQKNVYEIVSDQTKGDNIDPYMLCAIFTDFAESFLEKAFDTTQTIQQNDKMSKELYKANDLIRRLTDENEYHLGKLKSLGKQLELYKESWRGKMTEQSVERQISDLLKQKDEEVEDLKLQLTSVEQDFAQFRVEAKNSIENMPGIENTPAKTFVNEESEPKQFSELKGNDPSKYRIPKSMNFDQIYNELTCMDHKTLLDHCMDLKVKSFNQNKPQERSKSRSSSAVRSSQPCCVHKTLMQTEKNTENLEKRYKRIKKLADELITQNEIYQKDIGRSERMIESLEGRFNDLVEDFQKYINEKDRELAIKDDEIRKSKQTQHEESEENFNSLNVDPEERNKALEIYEKIMKQYEAAHERDEALLEIIKQYIYERKQPNIAYGIWEAADFAHCNNIEKTYKLMKALLQDCYIPVKRPQAEEIEEKHSFSFREGQLKESFDKERRMKDERLEEMKNTLESRNHEVLELKDIIRLKTQEYELLKQKFKDYEVEVLSGDGMKSTGNLKSNSNSGQSSPRKSKSQSNRKSLDKAIKPYIKNKREDANLHQRITYLEEENKRLKMMSNQNDLVRQSQPGGFEDNQTHENDATVIIGGVSHTGLNATEEHTSFKNAKLDMSPIQTRDRDASAADETILGVFDPTGSKNRNSNRKLMFDDQDYASKENLSSSTPDMNYTRSNKESLYKSEDGLIENLKNDLNDKMGIIDQLTSQINYFTKNSKDYSSPRFNDPQNTTRHRIKDQAEVLENISGRMIRNLENTEAINVYFTDKFENLLEDPRDANTELERISSFEKDTLEQEITDDSQILDTMEALNKLLQKSMRNLEDLYTKLRKCQDPKPDDVDPEQEKRMLHVKSNHELFLIKDLTEEVTRIIRNSKITKEEFDRVYFSIIPRGHQSESDFSELERSDFTQNRDKMTKISSIKHFMGDMTGFIEHLERLFHEIIDRSTTIIDNGDLIEQNYIRLLEIANGKSDQKKMICELHALNEDNLRTIMKLRKELICTKKANNDQKLPTLELDKVDSNKGPQSVVIHDTDFIDQPGRRHFSASLRSNIEKDTFLSKKLQEADIHIDKLKDALQDKDRVNQALENEIMRKDQTIKLLNQNYESTHHREIDSKQELNLEIQRQRKEFQKQIEDLNCQLDKKCTQVQDLVSELNQKDKMLRDNSSQKQGEYDSQKVLDDNKRMYREITVIKDEANKYKLRINQMYNELDSYKASLASLESQNKRLKALNDELNKTLADERVSNERGRDRVHDQMSKMSNKVTELEEVSESMENSKRDFMKKSDYLMQRLLDLRDYVISGDLQTSRGGPAPGTVRSNLSQMFSSVSRNPMELNSNDDSVEEIIRDIKAKLDGYKCKVTNYQTAINRLQAEKQNLYQSVNKLQVDKSQGFSTPVTKAANSSVKKSSLEELDDKPNQKEGQKTDAMVEYLRTEISHLRKKVSQNLLTKEQTSDIEEKAAQFGQFMSEIYRPGKDLIYQLCTDPHLSESFFYKEGAAFKGMDPKFCLDVAKIFDISNEKIVDLRTVLDHKEQVIRELDRKVIELRMKFTQQEQAKKEAESTYNLKVKENFQGLDQQCRNFASNLKVLSAKYEEEKKKCSRLDEENVYLKKTLKSSQKDLDDHNILKSNFEARLKIAKEEGMRQGRCEGIMDSKMNEYITKYKQDIEQQADQIVDLKLTIEKLTHSNTRLKAQVEKLNGQISTERNLQKTLSKEVEQLTVEVQALKREQQD